MSLYVVDANVVAKWFVPELEEVEPLHRGLDEIDLGGIVVDHASPQDA